MEENKNENKIENKIENKNETITEFKFETLTDIINLIVKYKSSRKRKRTQYRKPR